VGRTSSGPRDGAPTWPASLRPQHQGRGEPADQTQAPWSVAARPARGAGQAAVTATGTAVDGAPGAPRAPRSAWPQQTTSAPALTTAQACALPTARATKPGPMGWEAPGVGVAARLQGWPSRA